MAIDVGLASAFELWVRFVQVKAMIMTSEGAAIVLLLVLTTSLGAQVPPTWTQASAFGPAARRGHAMVYDVQRGRMVLFGGSTSSSDLGDTWVLTGSGWQPQIWASGPSARSGHSIVYDSVRAEAVLFGGRNNGGFLADTWTWNGTNWTQLAPSLSPSVRFGHTMAYDAVRQRVVLFGGMGGQVVGAFYCGDTWEWNGSNWLQVATTGPEARRDHAMVYDGVHGRTLVFGGSSPSNNLNADTWLWDGSSWLQVAVQGPQGRRLHAMTYDSLRGKTLLFGGEVYGIGEARDTWQWDGLAWTQVSGTGPQGRCLHAMAYDDQRDRTVLFGGYGSTTYRDDTWEWDSGRIATASTFGNGCGNPVLALLPVVNARPTIGSTAQVALGNVPASVAFVSLGWSRTTVGAFTLPLPLAGFGLPGCDLLQSAEAAAQPATFTGPGAAAYGLSLPNWGGLIGLHVYLQGWANAPGANAANAIVSNGIEWVIGNS